MRAASDEKPQQQSSRWERISTNPLTAVVVGFFLTWALGTLLTDHWKERDARYQRALDKQRETEESELKALDQLSGMIYDRITSADLLESALQGRWPLRELMARKAYYDSTYVRWNRQLQVTSFMVRTLDNVWSYSPLESDIQYRLAPRFKEVDRDLTEVYAHRLVGYDLNPQVDSTLLTQAKTQINSLLDCAYEITQRLWLRTRRPSGPDSTYKAAVSNSDSKLDERCPKRFVPFSVGF